MWCPKLQTGLEWDHTSAEQRGTIPSINIHVCTHPHTHTRMHRHIYRERKAESGSSTAFKSVVSLWYISSLNCHQTFVITLDVWYWRIRHHLFHLNPDFILYETDICSNTHILVFVQNKDILKAQHNCSFCRNLDICQCKVVLNQQKCLQNCEQICQEITVIILA